MWRCGSCIGADAVPFLEWLDSGDDSAAERYMKLHRRLVCYFDRKRCRSSDELADETLNRAARRLEEKGALTNTTPARYCYTMAKFVFLEYWRRTETQPLSLDTAPGSDHHRSLCSIQDVEGNE